MGGGGKKQNLNPGAGEVCDPFSFFNQYRYLVIKSILFARICPDDVFRVLSICTSRGRIHHFVILMFGDILIASNSGCPPVRDYGHSVLWTCHVPLHTL
jgi:hypothetical protein